MIMKSKHTTLAAILLAAAQVSSAQSQSATDAQKPAAQISTPTVQPTVSKKTSPYKPSPVSKKATEYYGMIWGVDSLSAKWTEAGEVIRFSYRVLDADKAKSLNDKKNEPSLIDPRAGVKLVVPSMEKIGQLRQSATPENGKVYWMAFSNKGRLVKRGDRIDVVIGQFRAEGLTVE